MRCLSLLTESIVTVHFVNLILFLALGLFEFQKYSGLKSTVREILFIGFIASSHDILATVKFEIHDFLAGVVMEELESERVVASCKVDAG